MVAQVHCSLLAAHYSLLAAHCSHPPTIQQLWFLPFSAQNKSSWLDFYGFWAVWALGILIVSLKERCQQKELAGPKRCGSWSKFWNRFGHISHLDLTSKDVHLEVMIIKALVCNIFKECRPSTIRPSADGVSATGLMPDDALRHLYLPPSVFEFDAIRIFSCCCMYDIHCMYLYSQNQSSEAYDRLRKCLCWKNRRQFRFVICLSPRSQLFSCLGTRDSLRPQNRQFAFLQLPQKIVMDYQWWSHGFTGLLFQLNSSTASNITKCKNSIVLF